MNTSRAKLPRESIREGISLKGVDGLLETIGGALVWFVNPLSARQFVKSAFLQELSEVPRDVLVAATKSLGPRKWYAWAFLLSHGLTKLVLVIAL